MSELNKIPSVDKLLNEPRVSALIQEYGRPLVVKAIREILSDYREAIQKGQNAPSLKHLEEKISRHLENWIRPSLVQVINASGIILHTNLGRAPLSKETIQAMERVSTGFSNLEYDLNHGKRGKREIHAEELLKKLTECESALVVNNNASAVLLILTALAKNERVVIANSQLVEIGGGFRIPDVMRQSSAKLEAIGTTNRVHLSDYQNALHEPAALVLTAHHSNFKIIGFTSEPPLKEITHAAHQANVPVVVDLGSGALLNTEDFGLAHEPTVQEALSDGADLVSFSGDKLFGGPQAGIILGKREWIEKIRKHPLARAVRADKLCLSGVSATLIHYLKNEAVEKIPVWQMIAMEGEVVKSRAEKWQKEIGSGMVIAGMSMVGGGSLPTESLPTYLFALEVDNPTQFHKLLRTPPTPVISRIENEKILLDPRTVLINHEEDLLNKVKSLMAQSKRVGKHEK